MSLEQTNRASGAAVGFLIASAVFAVATVVLVLSFKAPAINSARSVERAAALAEIRAAESAALSTPAILDGPRGIVRLPVEHAMSMAARLWADPAAARSDLKARLARATAALPKAPEQPSAFE